MACIIHLESDCEPELLDLASTLLSRTHPAPVVLIQTTSSIVSAAAQKSQLSHAASRCHFIVAQPSALSTALSTAFDYLKLPPDQIIIVTFSSKKQSIHQIKQQLHNCDKPDPSTPRSSSSPPSPDQHHHHNNNQDSLFIINNHTHPIEAAIAQLQQAIRSLGFLIAQSQNATVVAYAIKPSREKKLMQNGMLPLLSSCKRACFVPFPLESSLDSWSSAPLLQKVDVLLHKTSDFFDSEGHESTLGTVPDMTECGKNLLDYIMKIQQQQQHKMVVIDHIESVQSVFDRALLAHRLEKVCMQLRKLAVPIRVPAWYLLEKPPQQHQGNGTNGTLLITTPNGGVSNDGMVVRPPCIIKPMVACGIPRAHQMAIILRPDGFLDPELAHFVPFPAIVQEYVDHGSSVLKVYVAGGKVYCITKPSTPDLASHSSNSREEDDEEGEEEGGGGGRGGLLGGWLGGGGGGNNNNNNNNRRLKSCLFFNSLEQVCPDELRQDMPPPPPPAVVSGGNGTTTTTYSNGSASIDRDRENGTINNNGGTATAAATSTSNNNMNGEGSSVFTRREAVEQVAEALRKELGLTLFGFDLVFDNIAGELVLFDVNYFPSFKGIPEAPEALIDAIMSKVK